MIAALADCIREKGYRETTVADIVAGARTSRRTFYECFADRGDCFLELFTEHTQEKMELIAAAADPAAPLEEQVERAIDAFIDGASAEPALQRSFARELAGLGQAGSDALHAVTQRYADMLVALVDANRPRYPDLGPLPRDVAVVLVGGLQELLVISSGSHPPRDLHEIREPSAQVVRAILASLRKG